MNPWPVVALPALASLIGLFAGQDLRDQRLAKGLAVGASAASLVLVVLAWVSGAEPLEAAGPGVAPGPVSLRQVSSSLTTGSRLRAAPPGRGRRAPSG